MTLYNPQAPYRFSILLDVLRRFPAPALFRLVGDGYRRVLSAPDGLALVEVREAGRDLRVTTLIGDDYDDAALRWMLGVDCDLREFYAFARQQSALWNVIAPVAGMPMLRENDLFTALIFVIIEQHISWVNAQAAQRRLVEWCDNPIVHDGVIYHAAPTAARLAQATIDDLKPLKITFRRMETIIQIACDVVTGRLALDAWRGLPAGDLYRQLLTIKGVGHWTAAVVVGRVLGVFPQVPHNDVALQAAVADYFGVEKSATATQSVFAVYDNHAGMAAHFTLMRYVLDHYPPMEKTGT